MNGTSGFQDARSSTFRSPAYRLLHQQRQQSGKGSCRLPRTHNLVAFSTGISVKREKVPGCIQGPSATVGERHGRGYANSRFSGADR